MCQRMDSRNTKSIPPAIIEGAISNEVAPIVDGNKEKIVDSIHTRIDEMNKVTTTRTGTTHFEDKVIADVTTMDLHASTAAS